MPEFERQLKLGGQAFLNKAFTAEEQDDRNTVRLAGLWAAKEAVFKASPDNKPADWKLIDLQFNAAGKPSAEYGGLRYGISISHHNEYAIAVAIRST